MMGLVSKYSIVAKCEGGIAAAQQPECIATESPATAQQMHHGALL